MDWAQLHLDFLLEHVLTIVFCTFLIEAAGIPFPSRIILLIAATFTTEPRLLAGLVAVSAGGALLGDHVPYLAGALTGPRILALYCRLTLGSEDCVAKTVRYFTRFGPAAILLCRFSTSVRLFAAALSGCGHITYWRFLAFDLVGTVLYAALLVIVGRVIGESAAEFLQQRGGMRVLLFAGPLAFGALLGYRFYKRSRYGAAKIDAVIGGASCLTRDGTS
jgi:membrane protein DedA with SNARE-associated domain